MNSKNKCKTNNKLVWCMFIHGSLVKKKGSTAKKRQKHWKKSAKSIAKRDKNVRKCWFSVQVVSVLLLLFLRGRFLLGHHDGLPGQRLGHLQESRRWPTRAQDREVRLQVAPRSVTGRRHKKHSQHNWSAVLFWVFLTFLWLFLSHLLRFLAICLHPFFL